MKSFKLKAYHLPNLPQAHITIKELVRVVLNRMMSKYRLLLILVIMLDCHIAAFSSLKTLADISKRKGLTSIGLKKITPSVI